MKDGTHLTVLHPRQSLGPPANHALLPKPGKVVVISDLVPTLDVRPSNQSNQDLTTHRPADLQNSV